MAHTICRYCEIIRRLYPSANVCPECNHLMVGDTCNACCGNGGMSIMNLDSYKIKHLRKET